MNRYNYNKASKKGILRRMLEVKPMWRMCCLIKKHRAVWTDQLVRKELANSEEAKGWKKQYPKEVVEMMIDNATTFSLTRNCNKPLGCKRKTAANMYMHTYHCNDDIREGAPNENIGLFGLDDKKGRCDWREANSIIANCINREKPFITTDNDDPEFIYLTPDGESFVADRFGLWKEQIKSLGILWGVGITLLAFILSHLNTFIQWSAIMSPWW